MIARTDNPKEIGWYNGFYYNWENNTLHELNPFHSRNLFDSDRAGTNKRNAVYIQKGGYWFY